MSDLGAGTDMLRGWGWGVKVDVVTLQQSSNKLRLDD